MGQKNNNFERDHRCWMLILLFNEANNGCYHTATDYTLVVATPSVPRH